MPVPEPPAAAGHYVGTELELFQHAVHWKSYFTAQIRPFLAGAVLEVGAGMGGTTQILCRGGHELWLCLEPDARLAEQLGERILAGALPPECRAEAGVLADLPAAQTFDTILYIDVLEHIEDDRAEFRRAAEHLRPGGRVVVLAPAYQWLYSPFDAAIGHHRRYSRATLRAAAPPGVVLERLRYLDSAGVLASGANRFLMKQGMPTPTQIEFWDRVLVRLSRLLDPLTLHTFGKSVLGIWRRPV